MPRTIFLAVGAAIVWAVMGVAIGVISAIKEGSILDRAAMGFALFGVSAPVFWLGLFALWVFWQKLGILPGTGYVPFAESPKEWFTHLILPCLVLALLYAAFYARITQGQPPRDDGGGLHPHGPCEGPLGAEGHLQARPAGEPDADHHDVRDGSRAPHRRRGDHRDGLQLARASARGSSGPRSRRTCRSSWPSSSWAPSPSSSST